ncbi:DUF4097 domain-containing protein [Lactococcus hodotermopsidis]|uniref:DUF4097 domain-containing protein n=1 Tax=Pseudolactococcus hodotermopsidis TaxID=2709157 RepID=A0A6A0BD28_9LACT|nr:DUF4097 family beta strand repeat-containing protein [Lactococcus hodotermopsidis]GFH42565.1 DUF4097 domain-containing protein [Lactococcus hodotermopsidis]
MDLMRKGIITESEAIELLEKSGFSDEPVNEKTEKNKKVDKDGYQTDSSETFKQLINQAGALMKTVFSTAKKTVDNNVDFSGGFPNIKSVSKSDFKALTGEINDLNVSATSGDVSVSVKDVEKTIVEVSYKVYGGVTEEALDDFLRDNVVIDLDNGILTIDVKSKRIVADFTITLAAKQLEEATFDVVNGVVDLKSLVADDVTIKQVNGDLRVTGGEIKDLRVKAVNGKIRIATDFEKAEITNVNGDILVTTKSLNSENLKVKNVNGDVKISVPENIGLVGYVKTTFGSYKTRLQLDTPLEITKNGAALVRTATNSLTIDAGTNTGTVWLKDGEAVAPTAKETVTAEVTPTDAISDTISQKVEELSEKESEVNQDGEATDEIKNQ